MLPNDDSFYFNTDYKSTYLQLLSGAIQNALIAMKFFDIFFKNELNWI